METLYAGSVHHENANTRLVHASDGLVKLLGENAIESLIATRALATNTFEQGDRQKGLAMFAHCYQRAKESLTPHHKTTLKTLLGYCSALRQAGLLEEPRKLIHEVLQEVTDKYGPGSVTVIDLTSALANIDLEESNYSLALQRYKEIHALMIAKFGQNHVKTLISHNAIGVCYLDLGNYVKAEKIFSEVLKHMAKTQGELHPQTLRTVVNLGRAMQAMDRHQDARELIKDYYERSHRAFGDDRLETVMLATHYGRHLAEANELEAAEKTADSGCCIL